MNVKKHIFLNDKKSLLEKINNNLSSTAWTKKEVAILMLVIIISFLLRAYNLEGLQPYTDEYYHLTASQEILNGQNIFSVYQRSLFVVTLPTTLSIKLFGPTLFAARLPGIVFNVLAILPLYFLLRKLNKKVALIGILLYATNPWIIAVSRNVREYAFYPFIFYTLATFLTHVIQKIKKGVILSLNIKKALNKKILTYSFLLALPIIYALLIDPLSTMRVIFLTYIAFFIIIFFKLDFKNKKNKKILLFATPVAIISGVALIILNKAFIDFSGNITNYWLTQIFNNQPGQMYSSYFLIPIIIGAATCLFFLPKLKNKNIILFFFITFSLHLLYFSTLFSRYIRPRYGFSIQIWYIPVISISLYFFFLLTTHYIKNKFYLAVIASLLLISIKPITSYSLVYSDVYDKYHPITGEYHDLLTNTLQYIENEKNSEDVLIGTIPINNYHKFFSSNKFKKYFLYNSKATDKQKQKLIETTLEKNQSGFIVIDQRRDQGLLQKSDFIIKKTQVKYIGKINGQSIYRWDKQN